MAITSNAEDLQKRGWFIVVEGIDGSGKSSVAKALATVIEMGRLTREPNGEVRDFVLSKEVQRYPQIALGAFLANRAEHIKWINQRLLDGQNIVCDRFDMSTYAMGMTLGLEFGLIKEMNELALRDAIRPDLYIYLDIDVDKAYEHIEKRGDSVVNSKEFLSELHDNYEILVNNTEGAWSSFTENFDPELEVITYNPLRFVMGDALRIMQSWNMLKNDRAIETIANTMSNLMLGEQILQNYAR